jgi:phosphoribosyl-AMP cyclohydrolase
MDAQLAQTLKFDATGLIPAIIQDASSGEVLMMAWMNREALEKTLQTGKTHFFSRSRNKLWLKGESSGHLQHVRSVAADCDGDVLLIKVAQVGAACHDGYYSCFYREYRASEEKKWKIVGRKVFDPESVYG